MSARRRVLDDIARVATGAAGVLQGAGREAEMLMRQRLERAGVRLLQARVEQLQPPTVGGEAWRLQLAGAGELAARQVVLAAGAGCRSLWPELPTSLSAGPAIDDGPQLPASAMTAHAEEPAELVELAGAEGGTDSHPELRGGVALD